MLIWAFLRDRVTSLCLIVSGLPVQEESTKQWSWLVWVCPARCAGSRSSGHSPLSDLWNPNLNVEQFFQVNSYRSLLWQRVPVRPPLVRSLKVRLRLAEKRVGTCARGVDWRCSRRWARVPGGVASPSSLPAPGTARVSESSLPLSLPQGEGWAALPRLWSMGWSPAHCTAWTFSRLSKWKI